MRFFRKLFPKKPSTPTPSVIVSNPEKVRGISKVGLDLICYFESFYPKAYKDPVGIWTIGWGTIKYPNGMKVKSGDECTQEEAKEWLEFELLEKRKAVQEVDEKYLIGLTQNEFDALVSLAYNIGYSRFFNPETTIGAALKTGKKDLIAKSILVYDKAGGRTLRGLTRRRYAEKYLFTGEKDWTAAKNI